MTHSNLTISAVLTALEEVEWAQKEWLSKTAMLSIFRLTFFLDELIPDQSVFQSSGSVWAFSGSFEETCSQFMWFQIIIMRDHNLPFMRNTYLNSFLPTSKLPQSSSSSQRSPTGSSLLSLTSRVCDWLARLEAPWWVREACWFLSWEPEIERNVLMWDTDSRHWFAWEHLIN